jgi:hypothetical protein
MFGGLAGSCCRGIWYQLFSGTHELVILHFDRDSVFVAGHLGINLIAGHAKYVYLILDT